MSLQSTMVLQLTVKEPITTGVDLATAPVVTHAGLNTDTNGVTRDATTTVKAVKVATKKNRALAGGADTLDLTNLPGVNGAVVNMTGLKVNQVLITTSPQNAGPITFKTGAANGYALDGAGWQWSLGPGEMRLIDKAGTGTAVDATHKTIDATGSGTDVYSYEIVGG